MSQLEIYGRAQFTCRMTKTVTLMFAFCCLHGAAVIAQTPNSMRKTEGIVEQQVRAGEDVDLGKREISADFLAKLLKSYRPPADNPSRGIYIQNAEISGVLEFERVTIPYWLVLENCAFKEDVSFYESRFEKGLSLRGAIFGGKANFHKLHVDGDLRVNKAQFQNKKEEINFDGIRVTETVYFYQTRFDGPFTLSNSEMNELECAPDENEVEYTEFRNGANFYKIKVKGDASFTRASFDGPVDFGSIDIGKNLELTKVSFTNPTEDIGFFSMNVGGNAVFNATCFLGGFDLSKAEVAGNLEFGHTQAMNSDRIKNFTDMKVGTLIFDDAVLSAPYYLGGSDYRFLHAQKGGSDASLDLINGSTFSRDTYTFLEAYYRRIGLESAADDVYVAAKKQERERLFQQGIGSLPEYLGSWIFYVAAGYGKHKELALVWSLVFIGIGCLVFFCEDNMVPMKKYADEYVAKDLPRKSSILKKLLRRLRNPVSSAIYRWSAALKTGITKLVCWLICSPDKTSHTNDMAPKYDPLWYSIALFLPIVDLEDAKIWTPNPKCKWRRHYMRLHIILGYLLIPIGLAAWTGLIK